MDDARLVEGLSILTDTDPADWWGRRFRLERDGATASIRRWNQHDSQTFPIQCDLREAWETLFTRGLLPPSWQTDSRRFHDHPLRARDVAQTTPYPASVLAFLSVVWFSPALVERQEELLREAHRRIARWTEDPLEREPPFVWIVGNYNARGREPGAAVLTAMGWPDVLESRVLGAHTARIADLEAALGAPLDPLSPKSWRPRADPATWWAARVTMLAELGVAPAENPYAPLAAFFETPYLGVFYLKSPLIASIPDFLVRDSVALRLAPTSSP